MTNENKLIIKQLNKFGRVPQTHELLQMIEQLQQENKKLSENYDRIYNENCKLREEHNITDISLLDENYKLKDNWNKLKEYLNYKSVRAVGEDEYVYDEIYNEMQEMEKNYGNVENNT